MTVKEIIALRKSGHLQEALEASEREFHYTPNSLTAGALFWCLSDICRLQQGDEAAATLQRMHTLHSEHCAQDEHITRAMEHLKQRQSTMTQWVKSLLEKAKEGHSIAADYERLITAFRQGKVSEHLHISLGWLTYHELRNTPLQENAEYHRRLLHHYLALSVPRPSLLHSRILREAVRVKREVLMKFRLLDFLNLWGVEHLRDEDWERYHTASDRVLPSLVERLIAAYVKEIKMSRKAATDDFFRIVERAVSRYPDSQNMPYFMASVLLSQGRAEEALDYYRHLLVRYPSKSYLWHQAAAVTTDAEMQVALLCKAISSGAQEEFIGSARLRLATILMQRQMPSNALYELEKYRLLYQKKGWKLRWDYWRCRNQAAGASPVESNASLYASYAGMAEGFLYSALPAEAALKVSEVLYDDNYHPGRKVMCWTLRTDRGTFRLRRPDKFGLPSGISDGTPFDIRLSDGKIVWIKPRVEPIEAEWIRRHSGQLRLQRDRHGRPYALLDGILIGFSLLAGIADGSHVTVEAYRQNDGRWMAFALQRSVPHQPK